MNLNTVFGNTKPLIACIHLMPLPGSPGYSGSMKEVYETALTETAIFKKYKVDGLIVENFRDMPFYPDKLPAETIAALTAVTREIIREFDGPVGVNALRNDAYAALSVAVAAECQFIRVNVHTGAAITDQGIIEGKAHTTLRLRKTLHSNALIFADVAVKHASPLGSRSIELETRDLSERGLADAIIVSGDLTGSEAKTEDILKVRKNTSIPIILGSGATSANLDKYFPLVDGMIVGSYFKKDGKAGNLVEETRVDEFVSKFKSLS